ncbi:MAG TPA: zinc ribbon domain-containing protein [Solirubrobacteraceae bacterium]|nr:zinc ribbon domain-containing protein [Solirubrobacteraceae bacterium]
MPPLAYFGIESSGFSLAVNLLILFLAVLYFSLIYWTFQDARRRIADPVMVGLATFVACFPFAGPVIYMILRPPEFLEDVRERELELETAEARLAQIHRGQCPYCDYRIEREFVRCPSCLRKLKERCANCSRPLDQAWTICPYCEADVPGVSSPRVRRRRGGAVEGELSPPPYERPLAPEETPEPAITTESSIVAESSIAAETAITTEPAITAGDGTASAAERRSERRAAERRASAGARTAAARRPRPAP